MDSLNKMLDGIVRHDVAYYFTKQYGTNKSAMQGVYNKKKVKKTLTLKEVKEIEILIEKKCTNKEIAKIYDVNVMTISSIKTGKHRFSSKQKERIKEGGCN